MSQYRIRPGVVLSSVCGEFMLVATRKARGLCPYVKQINATGAYYWELLMQDMDFEQMVAHAADRYHVEPTRIRPGLRIFLDDLVKKGYLLPEEVK